MKLTRLTYALATAGFTSGLLIACGGGGGDAAVTPPVVVEPATVTQSVSVVDGPITGALVCLDKNANGACDVGETQGTTGADGSVVLKVPEADVGKYGVLAVVGTDATDLVNGKVTTPFTMQAPADKAAVVSPLTTLVAAHVASVGGTSLEAEKLLQERLGIASSLFADFSKAAATDKDSQFAATVARMVVVTTQQQLIATDGAKAADGSALSKADIALAINNSLLTELSSLVTEALDPAVSNAAPAAKEAAIKAAAVKLAAQAGITAANVGAAVAAAKLPATPDSTATPTAGSSLRWFSFTDAGNYSYRQFASTAAQNTVANGKLQFTEYRETKTTANGTVTNFQQWGEGLNNFARNSIVWTGSEWFDCPLEYVHEATPVDAGGNSSSLYCKAYKGSAKRAFRDIGGTKMVDVVKEIRAYPGSDTAGKFSAWGPDPVVHATALNAVFPAGSTLRFQTGQDVFNPDTYSPLGSDTVVAWNAGVSNGVSADCNKVTNSAPNNVQYQVATPTLEKIVSSFTGKPCVYTPSATIVADTGEPVNEWWGNSTLSIGEVADPYTNAKNYYRSGTKSLRASFAAGNVVNYWMCLRRISDGSPRNCVAAGSGSYAIETLGDGRVLRFAGVPANAASLLTYSRILVERARTVQYGSRGKLTTTSQIRLSKEATDALFAALGVPAKQAAAPLTPANLLTSYVSSNGVLNTNALAFMENDPAGLTGAWKLTPGSGGTPQLAAASLYVFFFANGQYAMADPLGDEGDATHLSCGNPGVEQGAFSFVKATGLFTWLSTSKDTNGCGGLNDTTNPANNTPITLVISTDGQTLTGTDQAGDAFTLTRASK
jgi:trimeric autotransporter adhesin